MLLDEAGSSLQDIVKVTVYLTDIRYREPVYRIMGRWLKGVYPVSTGLVVEALARPEWLVEIDATAVISATTDVRQMTFSLVARDDATGAFGIVICSSSPAVAARCAHVRATVGVVAVAERHQPRARSTRARLARRRFRRRHGTQSRTGTGTIPGLPATDRRRRPRATPRCTPGQRSLGVHTHAQGDQAVRGGQPAGKRRGDRRVCWPATPTAPPPPSKSGCSTACGRHWPPAVRRARCTPRVCLWWRMFRGR